MMSTIILIRYSSYYTSPSDATLPKESNLALLFK